MSGDLEWRFVTLARADGEPVRWPAIVTSTPGLIVHFSMGDPGWLVTHERSGLFIDAFDDMDAALSHAARLSAAGDWTRSGAAIKGDLAMIAKARQIRDASDQVPSAVYSHPTRGDWEQR